MLVRTPALLMAHVTFAATATATSEPRRGQLPAAATVRAFALYTDDQWVALITAPVQPDAPALATAYLVLLDHDRCAYASSLTVRCDPSAPHAQVPLAF